ncbi:MAG TPA: uroporphyrinogen decarboxylase family protein [Phycisphaerae bacterium]|nr:uroporphyrinogen decarboxylase family protein [Phycisphaerae bacterium]
MNSRERVRAAMRHQPCDRVPVMCQLALGHYFVNSDRRPSEIWFDSEVFVETLAEFQRRYGFDGFLINLPGRPANWQEYISSYENTQEGERLAWRFGLETWVPPDDNPHTFLPGRKPLPRADIETVKPSDPATYRIPGYLWNTQHAPTLWDVPADADLSDPGAYPDWLTRGLRAARANCPDVSVHMEIFSPFTHLLELFGYEQGLMALLDSPEICHELLEVLTGHVIAEAHRYAACDPDAILISSAFAGAGFVSREMYKEFVVPWERRVVEAIHGYDLPVYIHTCGAIGDRLDLMAESGADGLDTLDPPPLGTVDLARAKAEFGERFFFKGNLDAVNEMLLGDDAAFEHAVRERLKIGMPGSGYILSSACSVAPRVKPERLVRMVELVQEYGRY